MTKAVLSQGRGSYTLTPGDSGKPCPSPYFMAVSTVVSDRYIILPIVLIVLVYEEKK